MPEISLINIRNITRTELLYCLPSTKKLTSNQSLRKKYKIQPWIYIALLKVDNINDIVLKRAEMPGNAMTSLVLEQWEN